MIRLIITVTFSVFMFISSFAQNIKGDWYGKLDIQSVKLRISFHVKENNGDYKTTMDSPDQNVFDIPTDTTIVAENKITVIIKNMMVKFEGELNNDVIIGTFNQGGMSIPLNLTHQKIIKEKINRPQTPNKPYPYKSIEVSFINIKANNIKLAGTLTIPNNTIKPAVAILITGSGPQNRDEEILNHKPFLVIADYLTRNGIAVLRFDDRGVAQSEGKQKGATSADFATDVEAAINYLKARNDINPNKIGLIGHSEGGFIAPMVASENRDIAFIVLLAGPGVDGAKVLRTQTKKAFELAGMSKEHIDFNDNLYKEIYQLVKTENNVSILKDKMKKLLDKSKENAPKTFAIELTDTVIKQQVQTLSSPWMRYFIKINPKYFLNKVTCPVLALNGTKDFQVIADLNLNGIKIALKNNKDVSIKKLEGLNHLFQTCETGSFNEYAEIEETFSPKALTIITNWINKRF